MTASVVSLAAWVSNRPPACTCPRHQLDALADRVRAVLEDSTDALLIPREDLAGVLADLTATTDRLLPPTARTKP